MTTSPELLQPAKLCFLMDPWERLNLETETSLLLMDELRSRGHTACWLQQEGTSLRGSTVYGVVAEVLSTSPFELGEPHRIALNDLDAIVIRKDPPFDETYLHLTYLLGFVSDHVALINSPAALRDMNEKLSTLAWADRCPDTLVTMDAMQLAEFAREHKRIVIKPLDDCSGRGIVFVDGADPALDLTLDHVIRRGMQKFVLAQEYLPGVKKGDKRVFLVDGVPVGWVNRVPAAGKDLANIHQGASCHATELTEQERALSQEIGKVLVAKGVILAGLDFIDGRLTEINLTSPSAVRQINAVSNTQLETTIVDAILRAISEKRRLTHD